MTTTPPSGVPAAIADQLQRDDVQDRGLRWLYVAVAAVALALVACVLAAAALRVRPTAPAAPAPVVHVAAPPACAACPAAPACAPSLVCPAPVVRHHRGTP